MKPWTKTERIAVCIGCFMAVLSFFLLSAAIRSIRQANQMQLKYRQIQPLVDRSVELSRQINAELWAVMEEAQAIVADQAKPADQQPSDLEQRPQLNRQRIEGLAEIMTQQQRIIEQICEIQRQNGDSTRTESPETKAVLEKY
ncbi:MAG TPA: hypothetical protein PK052_03415 [Anaerohalosphaeraceae bacterium]|nr:hypothetical protein [Phycisphaerae bacterium]HOK95210.1 hypothetical protein [Anaerohalosphaeraceae bacterium]HOL31009.1 hypothetical protein [Anaerohalosphaeraceae bacterium]HOM75708.1 hypothetical protein [Anaerohalosphaeraceae bacterium]HPC64811.1 hypothetical protein [Anaerohalosphaeraceae bacterium]